ncbi:hypothetical protein U1Q18_046069, partial [Sarracenia purpurea var. burkii]
RHLLAILDKVAANDILVVLSLANICGKACDRLLIRCMENIVQSDVDIITLDRSLPQHIVKQIVDLCKELGFLGPESSGFPDKHVKRIDRALDSDDVELVKNFLKEGHTTLDDAYALHYAIAYCDAKTTIELLDLALTETTGCLWMQQYISDQIMNARECDGGIGAFFHEVTIVHRIKGTSGWHANAILAMVIV